MCAYCLVSIMPITLLEHAERSCVQQYQCSELWTILQPQQDQGSRRFSPATMHWGLQRPVPICGTISLLNRSQGHSTKVPNSHCCRCGLPSSLVYCALAVHPCIYLGSACGSNARCRHGRKCASCGSSEGRTCGGAQATLGKRLRPNEGLDTHHGRAQISREKDGEKKGRRGGLLWCWARVLAREEKLNRDHQDPGRVRGPSRVM
jgi:hypothetical protein